MKTKTMPSGVNMDELVGNTDQFADSGYVKLLSDAVPGTDIFGAE